MHRHFNVAVVIGGVFVGVALPIIHIYVCFYSEVSTKMMVKNLGVILGKDPPP